MWRILGKAALIACMSVVLGWLAYGVAAYRGGFDVSVLVIGCISYVLIVFFILAD